MNSSQKFEFIGSIGPICRQQDTNWKSSSENYFEFSAENIVYLRVDEHVDKELQIIIIIVII